mmetsp:Transcript_3119/g.9534  ORF Transcript_3119/g.9534 Transcript_3119/m.9534 type:complete len:212 (+) Transcript_3119:305-940(+)
MRLRSRRLVLLPHLDGLVCLDGDETRSRHVKRRPKDAGLTVEGARLYLRLCAEELVRGVVVPERQRAVVASGHQHAVLVHRQRVYDHVVPREVAHKLPLGEPPSLDVVGRCRRKGKLPGVHSQRTHALLVVCERGHALSCGEVPQPHRRVGGAREHLGVDFLGLHAVHGVAVAAEGENLGLGSHVPHTHGRVPAASHQDVEARMERRAVHT